MSVVPSSVATMEEEFKSHFPILRSKRGSPAQWEQHVRSAKDGNCGMKNKDFLILHCTRMPIIGSASSLCTSFLSFLEFLLLGRVR